MSGKMSMAVKKGGRTGELTVEDEELELGQGMESSSLAEDMGGGVKRKEQMSSEACQPGHWISAKVSLQHWEQK